MPSSTLPRRTAAFAAVAALMACDSDDTTPDPRTAVNSVEVCRLAS